MNPLYRFRWWLLGLALLALLLSLVTWLAGGDAERSGPFVIAGLICLAVFFQAIPSLSNLSFTTGIFAAVAAAIFYPYTFSYWGGFDLKQLIVPLLMIIMFGMGTAMSPSDFLRVLKMPQGVFVGLICQFTIMPLVGWAIAYAFGFPPEIAAGIILVGCSPSGLASNVMSYIARANLALSLTLTAIATLLAPLLTPLLMTALAGQLVPIDFWAMMQSILKIVILPVILGLLFNHYLSRRLPWMERLLPRISMAGITLIIAIITAAGREDLLAIGAALLLAALLHNIAGYGFGYLICRLIRMDEASCRTVAFEVGMQNSGLASGIALEMGKVATMGLAPIVFGPLMNITGSSLAGWWRRRNDWRMEIGD